MKAVLFKQALVTTLLILKMALDALCSEDEERLVRDLFRDYNKLIRPVQAINETVEVEFAMSLIQLIHVNEKNQVMTSNVWLQLRWRDYQLKWDEADYGGISTIRMPQEKVWKPDLVLFNNADGNYEVRYKCNVLIHSTGEVQWVPPAIYQSSCTIDVTYFPFDEQKCLMKFSSWTFNGDQVSLKLYSNVNWIDLSDYWKSGTWDIVEVPAYLNVLNNSRYNKPTETDITFHIKIRRKTLFYTVNLILPTILISFLCILVFYLPAEAGEKVTLGINILLSLVVFLLLVSKILPPTSLVLPLIAKYLLFTFIMNCISILVTVVIINWNFRGPRTHKMPNWIRVIFLKYLPVLLFMRRPEKTRLRWMLDMPSLGAHYHPHHPHPPPHHHQQGQPSGVGTGGLATGGVPNIPPEMKPCSNPLVHNPTCNIAAAAAHHQKQPPQSKYDREVLRDNESLDMLYLTPEAYKATEAIEFIAEHLRSEDEYIQIREDWKYVAMVIDRLQLYIFFIVTTAGTLGILLDAPHIFEYVDQDKVIELHAGQYT